MGWEERFWSKVDRSGDGCWTWMASTDTGGYGQFQTGGRPRKAHRLSWEMANGPIPPGAVIRHDCDNPPCVNPAHLRPGTHADNMADQLLRGRRPKHADRWVSLRYAAISLGVTTSSLRHQIARGRLSAFMSASWVVRWSEVERYRRESLGKRKPSSPITDGREAG